MAIRLIGASGCGDPLPYDEALEVIDNISHPDLHFSAVDTDGVDEEPLSILFLSENMLDTRSDR